MGSIKSNWYDDPDEVVAFARWYWEGTDWMRGTLGEVFDYFEEPWHFTDDYWIWKEDTDGH